MGGRPVLMQRFPQGAGGPSFFQKRVPDERAGVAGDDDGADRQRHAFARARRRRRGARRVGGQPGLPRGSTCGRTAPTTPTTPTSCGWTSTRSRAPASPRRARRRGSSRRCSTSSGIAGFAKTTGNRGLHVYVRLEPRWDSYEVRSAAVAVARELERRRRDLLTAAWWKEERGERIFVDYNQNAPHKTVFGAWSVRARVGAQVSDAAPLGGARRRRPRRADARDRAGAAGARRRSMGGDRRRAAVAGAAARAARARPRERAAWTRRGRRSIRSSPTSRRASRRAGRGRSSRGRVVTPCARTSRPRRPSSPGPAAAPCPPRTAAARASRTS